MTGLERMKELVILLNEASTAYYRVDKPIMSDKQYDDLYDELKSLEDETGIAMATSPTQIVQGEVVDYLEKVQHKTPMLSADKTKELSEIKKFIGKKDVVQSWKLDGLTVVVEYKNGLLHKAITRGNGTIGENVTHTFKHCINLPQKLKEPINITFRGECVIPWGTFKEINSSLKEPYSHPRNLAAGSLRQLDSMIARNRQLEFYVFDVIDGYDSGYVDSDFLYASNLGMPVVDHCVVTDVETCCDSFNPDSYRLPVDGLIYKYNDTQYGKSLGSTSKFPLDMMALKWEDELYETTLIDIEWNTSKTGLINPVAIFEPVDLGGAITTRATLHNISYIEDLELGIGDTIQVYRSNMVIPKIHDNLTRSNTWKMPDVCPCCEGNVYISNNNGSKALYCSNPDCKAKRLGILVHSATKNALNIDGLSEATIEKFINLGLVSCIKDIYHLTEHIEEISSLDGFGIRSAKKLIKSIENSRNTTLDRFIYALSIPLIGRSASQEIAKVCNYDVDQFEQIIGTKNAFLEIDGFGEEMNTSIRRWWSEKTYEFLNLKKEFVFEVPDIETNANLNGKTFVITGSTIHYSNRDELKKVIGCAGGRVSGSVSAKTDYLINNDKSSNSSKNKKAKSLNIPIISEMDFLNMIGE